MALDNFSRFIYLVFLDFFFPLFDQISKAAVLQPSKYKTLEGYSQLRIAD